MLSQLRGRTIKIRSIPRWNRTGAQAIDEPYDAEPSEIGSSSSEVESSVDQDETSLESEPTPPRRSIGRPKGSRNKVKVPIIPESQNEPQSQTPYITKSGRIIKTKPKH